MSGIPDSGKSLGVSADPTNAMLAQFLQLLQRRKVLWEFKIGIVSTTNAGNSDMYVLLDGDTNPIICRTLIGPPPIGAKVAVIFVPPTGHYVIGVVGGQPIGPLGLVTGVVVTTTGGLTTTTAAEANIPQLQISCAWNPTRAYEVVVQVGMSGTVATDTYNINLRRDTALTGTLLGTKSLTAGGIDTPTCSFLMVPSSIETVSLFVSHVRRTGTGTFSAFGGPGGVVARTQIFVRDVGLASAFTTA